MPIVERVNLRGILDSRCQITVEAGVALRTGRDGVGSCAIAIAPGRRERRRSPVTRLGDLSRAGAYQTLCRGLARRRFEGQEEFDAACGELAEASALGANVTVALSLAFARACAADAGLSLCSYVAQLAGSQPRMPHPLINLLSGGIHVSGDTMPFQEIMFAPRGPGIVDDIEAAMRVFAALERLLDERGMRYSYSAASGLVVEDARLEPMLDLLGQVLAATDTGAAGTGIGIDVAAEHLRRGSKYALLDRSLSPAELGELLLDLVRDSDVRYLEDPFDPADEEGWRGAARGLRSLTHLVGDDIFATNASYMTADVADGAVVKISQVGSLARVVAAVRAARSQGMTLTVSHRSGETEDCAMCDMAVGLGAEHIKIGGPRRGDRIAKYNQLLRLSEGL